MSKIAVSSFYSFASLTKEQLEGLRQKLLTLSAKFSARGLIITANEGINATVSVGQDLIQTFQQELEALWKEFADSKEALFFKNSFCDEHPFRRFVVKIKKELVTSGGTAVLNRQVPETYLSPTEWHHTLENSPDAIVLDTRNDYEVALGKFRGAVEVPIESFTKLFAEIDKQKIPRDTPLLTYCTGGIRCEKAVLALHDMGFHNVFQLHGGILNYLEQFPDGHFEGECFVFDDRVALQSDLTPSSQYSFCRSCGDPSKEQHACRGCSKLIPACPSCASSSDVLCRACKGRAEFSVYDASET